jgi:hypothetical protein
MKFILEVPDQLVSSAAGAVGGAQSTSALEAISGGGAPAIGGVVATLSSGGEEYSAGSAEQPVQAQGSSIATFDGGAAPRS